MEPSLILTKTKIPRLRSGIIGRPDLIDRLRTALDRPLILVSAPAGYGKTTLLAELAFQMPVAWLSLDEEDNDPVRFWSHFIASLQQKQPFFGETIHQILTSFEPPSMRPLLVDMINEMTAAKIPSEVLVIILDDYHLIDNQKIHRDMEFLLEHLPSEFHLIISTRADPPLPLARLRARGQLSEFRARDLRFNLDEIEKVLNGMMGLALSPENISALEEHTEGWIASLQMAAISMQNQADIPAFIAAFTGTHRHILDYLTEEILSQQTEEIRSFLIRTSVLHHLNGSLCSAITGCPDGAEILARLDSVNLFLVPLDNERKWYRYHHLFSSILYSNLVQLYPDDVNDLRKKAAVWFEENGLPEEAVSYALEAKDFDLAAELLEAVAREYIMRSEYRTLLNWLIKIPDEIYLKHPSLAATNAFLFSNMGQIETAETWLKRIEGITLPHWAQRSAPMSRAYVAIAHKDDQKAIELLKSIGGMELKVGVADYGSQTVKVLESKIFADFLLIHLYKVRGNLRLAIETGLNTLSSLNGPRYSNHLMTQMGLIHTTLAELLYEQNKLENAMRHAVTGLEMANQSNLLLARAYGITVRDMVRRAKEETASESGHRDSITPENNDGRLKLGGYLCYPTQIMPLLTRMRFAEGNARAVVGCIKDFEQVVDLNKWRALARSWPGDSVDVAVAYARLAECKFAEAEVSLRQLENEAATAGRAGNMIEILLLRALALNAVGNISQALDLVERAIITSEPEGYVRIFVDLGQPMAALLKQAAQRNSASDYIPRLLAQFVKPGHARLAPAYPIMEPLTVREIEVLKLLASGFSNPEIARKLVLTPGTVKVHVHHIYSKFEVRTRAQAIKRAIDLNLL
jgi:LuxR family transcriptional regulator, maltose regulon positive regulatory protein